MPGYVRLVEVRTGKFWLSYYVRLGQVCFVYVRVGQILSGLIILC